jgi:hypothetical protein
MPLVQAVAAEGEPVDEATRRARKVLPRYARGEPRRIAVGLNLPQAELMQGILLEEGIPSFLRRCGGFDVPDMLAAGPRDILVPESAVEAARQLLSTDGEAMPVPEQEPTSRVAMRIAAGMLAGLLLFGALAGLILSLIN